MAKGCCLEDLNGREPCVLDPNQDDYTANDCIHTAALLAKGLGIEDCEHWKECTPEPAEVKSELARLYDALGLKGDDRCIDGVIGQHTLNVNAIKLLRQKPGAEEEEHF